MHHLILIAFLFLALPSLADGLDMTSIQPATTSPGATITLTGGPFSSQTVVVLGNIELVPTAQNRNQVQVSIPADTDVGDYVIYLAEGEQTSREAFILHLVEPRPVISEVFPSSTDICQPDGSVPLLRIEGQGFLRGAKALVNGAAVQLVSSGTDHLEIGLPPLEGGSHQVRVVNPSGSESIPHNFIINSRPEITQIAEGDNQVNSYQLIISGRNFHPKLQLAVDGKQIRATGTYIPPNNDIFEYIDCGTILYTRFQVTGQLRRSTFRILNPGGQQSVGYEATIR